MRVLPSLKSLVTMAVVAGVVYVGIEHYKTMRGTKK